MSMIAERPRHVDISDALEETIQQVRTCPCCGEVMVCVPQLTCADCGMAMDVKTQIYKSSGAWYAECLTLDLLSRGDTPTDAVRRLQIAMFSYIATVFNGDGSTKGLIPRRAPLSSWIRYYANAARTRLAILFGRRIPPMTRAIPTQYSAEELRIPHCSLRIPHCS